MNFFGRNLQGPSKVIVIFAAIFLVSAGMCGIQIAIIDKSPAGSYGGNAAGIFLPLGLIELAAMAVSLVGIVIVLIVWAIGALTRQDTAKPLLSQPPSPESSRSDRPADQHKPNDANGNT